MAGSSLSPAKALLLAVQLATKSDISTLRTLVSKYQKTLRGDLVLRVLLTYLPESLEASEYVVFIQDLLAGNIAEDPDSPIDPSALEEVSELAASKRVRKLHLLPLLWPNAPEDAPAEHLVQFLIHRSLRIDENTGLITLLPELLVPFLHHSSYLRTWTISTVLPLLRLNYKYHPQNGANISIPTFEGLDNQAGVAMLLSRTGSSERDENTVGRDLRGLVGPWMYGDARSKRRRVGKSSSFDANSVAPLGEHLTASINDKCASWEEVFKWVVAQATASWKTAVEAVEQWDGPGDVDLEGYDDGTEWLDEEEQQHLERRYVRAALACAYLISDDSMDGLMGIRRILGRIHTLLDHDPLPTIEVAAALLSPVSGVESLMSPKSSAFLRGDLLEESNILTNPTEPSIKLLHGLLVSAFLIRRAGMPLPVRRIGQLLLLQDEREQKYEFEKVIRAAITKGAQSTDDRYWVRMRNEILWLRNWGAEELTDGADVGIGVFGRISKEFIEIALLRELLSNNRIPLARQIYETAPIRPITQENLLKAVLSEAMNAYDNATNPNGTRGGLKRCNDILKAFPDTVRDSAQKEQLEHLVRATHLIGQYRLVFKQGEPFRPVMLRVHGDPISILGKVLDQNRGSYTEINDFIRIGMELVRAGLTCRNINGDTTVTIRSPELQVQGVIVEKRVVSMCIDAALAEDDFETAYSYIMTRLVNIAGPAQERTTAHNRNGGLFAELPPKMLDDWSWRAALQAGKYRRTAQTVQPTHVGNASGNPDIRHLEQRMECLSHAVRLAPKSTLHEILNVFRRCEEELESLSKQEDEQEAAWDAQGDDQVMPGGFGATPKSTVKSTSRAEEAPMSLFDLSRGALTRAQRGFGSLSRASAPESDSTGAPRERRRDQLRNAAVGTVAAGVGWLIGAPGAVREEQEDR